MKTTILIYLALAITGAAGCIKEPKIAERTVNDSLIASWELRSEQNGMTPYMQYPSGTGNLLKFSTAGYERYKDGALVQSGSYHIISDSTVVQTTGLFFPPGQFTNRIVFDNDNTAPKLFFEVADKKLFFLTGYFPTDGGTRKEYERQ